MKATIRMKIIILISFACLCTYATALNAGTIDVADYGDGSCSLLNAQSAYNDASAGDTIVFPAGTCTWSSTLTIRKPISIIGAGFETGGTKLISSGSMLKGFFNITEITSEALCRISGFYFEMKDMTAYTAICVESVNMDNIRIDHNIFNQGNKPILFYNLKGLIDNNYFYNGNLTIEYTAAAKAYASWESMAAGTADALFIEDNFFIHDANFLRTYTNESIGTFNGGKLVVRYNRFESNSIPDAAGTVIPIMTHGNAGDYWQKDNNARRGQSVVEIYNNNFGGKRIDFPVIVRGSANLIYNNVIGKVKNTPRIQLREEEYDIAMINQINPLRTAWPAEDQVHNTFIWNNTYDGVQMTKEHIVAVPDDEKIKQNRDYFLHAPQATGGSEIFTGKNGAAGSYPTDGIKYPTLGTMIFTPEGPNAYYPYKAYAYPHPLRNESVDMKTLSLLDSYDHYADWELETGKSNTYSLEITKYIQKEIVKILQDNGAIVEVPSKDMVETTQGSFYFDSATGEVFIHCTNSNNPSTYNIQIFYR